MGSGVADCHFIRDHRVKKVHLTSSDNQKIWNFIKALNFSLPDQPMASPGAMRSPEKEESFISSQSRGNYFFFAFRVRKLLDMCSKHCWLRILAQESRENAPHSPSTCTLLSLVCNLIRNPPHPSPSPIDISKHLCRVTTHQSKLRP